MIFNHHLSFGCHVAVSDMAAVRGEWNGGTHLHSLSLPGGLLWLCGAGIGGQGVWQWVVRVANSG